MREFDILARLHPLELLSGFIAVMVLAAPREYFKAWIASLLGDDTPRKAGRLSWNPLVHLDPIGTITFMLFDFGWTRPIPLRPWRMKSGKRGLLLVSVAGPVLNIIEAFVFALIAKNIKENAFTFSVMYKSTKYSLTYGFFSLFPIPPLDGSKILGALLPDEYSEWYLKYEIYGTLFMLSMLVLWILPLMMHPFVNIIDKILKLWMGA